MYRRGKRVPAQRFKPPTAQHQPFPAPTLGWVSGANLANGPRGSALILENYLPTATGLAMRKGSQKHATAASGHPLESAFAYIGGTSKKMFGACNGSIFNLTSIADPNTPPAADVTGQTSNYYAAVNMATSGGYFLLIANGTDNIQKYDGASWAAIAMGGGAGQIANVSPAAISHLNKYRNRIWMVQKNTMDIWYLPTDSIAGAATRVALSGIFAKGGSVLFTATRSLDTGDGDDDRLVIVTTEGEVAIFAGDPALADWGHVGKYDCAPPLGKNGWLNVGGDLLILTDIGLIPLSAISSKDAAALGLAAVSANIQPDWVRDASTRRSLPWEIVKWTGRNIAFITCPVTGSDATTPPWCYAVNLETGAWTKITGWNTRCFVIHDDWAYFGTNQGTLIQTEITGADDGALINYLYVGQFDHLGAVGRYKTVKMARAVFRTRTEFTPQISVATDYKIELQPYPNAAVVTASPGEWDAGVWDSAKWDTGLERYVVRTRWVSVGRSGEAHAPVLQITSGSEIAPSAELVIFELLYETGGYDA